MNSMAITRGFRREGPKSPTTFVNVEEWEGERAAAYPTVAITVAFFAKVSIFTTVIYCVYSSPNKDFLLETEVYCAK